MTEGKRRDPRAKVLSMTVRYKSATVDEFIENHSHDVSRGGIFIKTASPFPAGTLIKFEVKIDDDRAVLQGVGRVVWKRDQDAGDGSGPAGMGVKFIKIGPESRQLIDQVVSTADRTSGAFDLGARQAGVDPKPSILPTASHAPVPEPTRRVGGTVMGLGPLDDRPTPIMARPAIPQPPEFVPAPPALSSTPELSALDAPTLDDISTDISGEVEDDEEFDEESTAVHQAGQLLEAAFTGLGGSMEEAKIAEKPKSPAPGASAARASSDPREGLSAPVSGGSRPQPPSARKADETRSVKKKGQRKAQAPRRASSGPTSASAPMHEPPKVNRPQVVATTPPARGAGKGESGGGSAVVWVLLIGAVVAAAVYLSSSEPPSGDGSAMPAPVPVPMPAPIVAAPEPPATPVPTAAPIPSAAAIPSAAPPPELPGSAGATSAGDDAASQAAAEKVAAKKAAAQNAAANQKAKAEAAKAAEKLATQMAEAAAAVRAARAAAPAPRPKPNAAPAEAPATPAEPTPPPPAPAAPTPPAPAAPTPLAPAAPAPTPAPPPAPAPKPAPAPTPPTPAGDNPY